MCAVGRCLVNAPRVPNTFAIGQMWEGAEFKPEYEGFNVNFWQRLQRIHDNDENWDKGGITEKGKNAVAIFKHDLNSHPNLYVQYIS